MKRLSTRNARLIRSALDAGKGAARLFADYPQGRNYAGTVAIFHYDPDGDLWERAVARSFHRWLPGFWQEFEGRREAHRAAQEERRARDPKPPAFELRSVGLNHSDTAVFLHGKEARGVRSATITVEVGQPTRVELELLVLDVSRLCAEDPEYLLAPGTEEAMLALGWTHPDVEPEEEQRVPADLGPKVKELREKFLTGGHSIT